MARVRESRSLYDRIAALREQMVKDLAADLTTSPQFADEIMRRIDALLEEVVRDDMKAEPPPDKGLAALAGIGEQAARDLGDTLVPPGVIPYDESVTSERMLAVADLYYLYQHETIGVFRVMQKLQELFRAGAVRLSSGPGAFALYQFDRREVLRYTQRDRLIAYRRAFGYGNAPVLAHSRANTDFHHMFTHFINQVALYWRDKRISDVIRERAYDPSFGSVAIVRRAGLDLRNNLKFMSFGHLNVMRVEVMQLLDESFRILNAPDIRELYSADTAWDVIEEVLVRHFNERLVTSPRQRMAVTGRDILRWLAQGHILQPQRPQFEALLLEIAESAEEWLTSAQALGLARRSGDVRVMPWDRDRAEPISAGRSMTGPPRPPGAGYPGPAARGSRATQGRNGRRPTSARDLELEYEL
ncbi:MAG: hypothetical protein N2378_08220 [Chloroflexaceae bacterium]|nr:hypothetical protein [Chloroflexaceae bacterium]